MRTIAICYGITLFLFSNATMANDGDSAAIEEAKQHFTQGMSFFDNEDYDKAVEAFRKAYEAKPTWKLRYNIAQAEAAAKRYGLALEEFEAYLGKGGDEVLIEREKDVLREIDRLRMLVGVLDVKAPEGTEIYVDDVLRGTVPLSGVLRIAVGEHHVWMRQNGLTVYDGNVKIAGAVRTRLDVAGTQNGVPSISTFVDDTPESGTPEENGTQDNDSKTDDVAGKKSQRFAFFKNMSKKEKMFFFGGIASTAVGIGALGGGVGFTIAALDAADQRDNYEVLWNDAKIAEEEDLAKYYANAARKKHSEVSENRKLMIAGYVAGGILAAAGTTLLVLYSKNGKKKKVAVMPTINGIGITF